MWSADDWQPADFAQPSPKGHHRVDPWQTLPVQGPRCQVPGGTGEEADLGVWFDELQAPKAGPQAPSVPITVPAGLESVLSSLEFDPRARQEVWRWEPAASDGQRSQARRKAATLVALLDISRARDRESAFSLLTDLFEDFPHSSTYEALLSQVAAGADLDTLRVMGELKRLWLATPEWWSRRRYCPLRRQPEFIRDRQGTRALSWRLARRISEARWRWPVENMIPEAWLGEWREAPFALHGSWSFAEFLDWRLNHDSEDECGLTSPGPAPHGAPAALAWQEIAASSAPLADFTETRSLPRPDQLQ